jgi:DNA end-binding protein Ku
LIDKKTHEFDPEVFKDHYQQALRALIERKLKSKGKRVTPETEDEPKRSRPAMWST